MKNQRYCGAKACQRERKRKWQREKLETDSDYRATKRESQRAWQRKNPAYWEEYRRKKPDYGKRNRQLQQVRNRTKRKAAATEARLAKMDTLEHVFDDTSVTYIISASSGNIAKMDALHVKIIPITPG